MIFELYIHSVCASNASVRLLHIVRETWIYATYINKKFSFFNEATKLIFSFIEYHRYIGWWAGVWILLLLSSNAKGARLSKYQGYIHMIWPTSHDQRAATCLVSPQFQLFLVFNGSFVFKHQALVSIDTCINLIKQLARALCKS